MGPGYVIIIIDGTSCRQRLCEWDRWGYGGQGNVWPGYVIIIRDGTGHRHYVSGTGGGVVDMVKCGRVMLLYY